MQLKYEGLDFSANGPGEMTLRINRVTGQRIDGKEEKPVFDEYRLPSFSVSEDKVRNTVVRFAAGVPFTRVVLDVANPYFYRNVACYAEGEGKQAPSLLQSASIYRLLLSAGVEANAAFACTGVGAPSYSIVVSNGSNPALDIRGIRLEWLRRELFFVALGNAPAYTVRLGNPAAVKPSYDLANSVHQANWRDFASLETVITGMRENPSYSPPPAEDTKARREKTVLVAVVCALVAVMGFWLFSLFRKTGTRKKDEES